MQLLLYILLFGFMGWVWFATRRFFVKMDILRQLQANIDSLDRAIADEKLIRVLLRYDDLVLFVLKHEIEEDMPYEALNRGFAWLQNRIGFNAAPPKRNGE